VGVLDATSRVSIAQLFDGRRAALAIDDPPYNLAVGRASSKALFHTGIEPYLAFSRGWIEAQSEVLANNAHIYVWMGTDPANGFQPLPDFMLMMRELRQFTARNFVTLRNQRGYGTQNNWMWVRQELLHYARGAPPFRVVYTDIPKILRGYYKSVGGRKTENLERGKSPTIRPGNVWVDIQQVFYRMAENVPGAYAQKPLAAYERLIDSSSREGDLICDLFAHSGTTLIGAERLGRQCFTSDNDPLFAELTIRRLEHFRRTGRTGWQVENPFPELGPPLQE
jgi:site-specific DNA-methyltransferase (adenine-specific)